MEMSLLMSPKDSHFSYQVRESERSEAHLDHFFVDASGSRNFSRF